MADNIDVTPGTGKTVATDDVSGVQFQKVKLDIGGDGLSSPVTDLATSAKQPALGTAGTPSADVITVQGVTSMTALKVDGSAVTQPVSGTISVTGVATAANQTTANSSLSSIDGKITAVNTGAVVLAAGTAAFGKLAANSGVDIGDVDVTSVTPGTSATSLGKAEDSAHSSGDTGVFVLGVRNDAHTDLTNTDGDYSPIAVTPSGRVQVTRAAHSIMVRGTATTTNTSDTSLIAAAGVGLKNYITGVQLANTGSTTSLITMKDGSGGSTLAQWIVPAGSGSNIYLDIPIVTSANTALYFAAGSSSTTIYVNAQGYKAP